MNPVDIIIKMSKIEKGILKAAKKANSYTQRDFHKTRLSADFTTETLQVRRDRCNIFKLLKGKKLL